MKVNETICKQMEMIYCLGSDIGKGPFYYWNIRTDTIQSL